MQQPDHKLVRYYRPERYKGGGTNHIGIEIERIGTTVTIQDLVRPRTFYSVPVEDVKDVSAELKARIHRWWVISGKLNILVGLIAFGVLLAATFFALAMCAENAAEIAHLRQIQEEEPWLP